MALLPSPSLSSSSASFTPSSGVALPTFPRQTFTRVFPDHPPLRGPPHLVSPLPRGVSIPGASGALLSPSRAAAPDCPNAILESLAPAESCVWTSRAAAPKPRGGRGRAERGTVPGHPGPRRSPRRSGRAPSRGGAAAAAFPGFPGPGLGEAGDRRHGGDLCPRVLHSHRAGSARAPRGRGNPVPRRAWRVRAVTSPSLGGETGRAEVTSCPSARAMAAAAVARVAA